MPGKFNTLVEISMLYLQRRMLCLCITIYKRLVKEHYRIIQLFDFLQFLSPYELDCVASQRTMAAGL